MSSRLLAYVTIQINTHRDCYLERETYGYIANKLEEYGFECTRYVKIRERPSCAAWSRVIRQGETGTLADIYSVLARLLRGRAWGACRTAEEAVSVVISRVSESVKSLIEARCGKDVFEHETTLMKALCVISSMYLNGTTITIRTLHGVDVLQFMTDPVKTQPDIYTTVDLGAAAGDTEFLSRLVEELNNTLSLTIKITYPQVTLLRFPLFRLEAESGLPTSDLEKVTRIAVLKGHTLQLIRALYTAHQRTIEEVGRAAVAGRVLDIAVEPFNTLIPEEPDPIIPKVLAAVMGVEAGRVMEARQYQLSVIGEVLRNLRRFGRATIEVATGGGKTEIAIGTVISILNSIAKSLGDRVADELEKHFPIALVTTIRRDLVRQFAERARQYGVPAVYFYGTGLNLGEAAVSGIYGLTEQGFKPPPIVAFSSMSLYYAILFILAVLSKAKHVMTPEELEQAVSEQGPRGLYNIGKSVLISAIERHIGAYLMGTSVIPIEEEIKRKFGIRYNRRTNAAYDSRYVFLLSFARGGDIAKTAVAQSLAEAVYDAVGYVLDADKAEQIASKLMSIIEGLRERARTPHKLAEAIGKTLSETARQEVVNLTGISLPEDFRVRMDTVLVRYILMSRFADLIESWRGSGEAVIDDVEEGGPTTDEVTEELYEMSISAVEANASLLTKIAWFLIFNAPPTLLVIDEAHHTPASSFIAAIMSLPKTAVLGMSATPYRGDKMDQLIYGLAGSIVARVSSSELILNNYLSLPVIVVDRYDISRDNPELYEQYDKTSKGIDVLLNAIATQDAEKIIASVRSLGDTISKILTGMDWDYVYNNLLQRKEVVDLIDEILSLTRERSEAMRTSQVFKAAAAARSISQKIKRLKDRLIAIAASALGVDISSREPIGLRTPREWMSTLVELFIVRLILDRFGIEEGIARTAVSRLKAHLKYVKTALAINAIVFNNKRTEHILSVVRTAIESRLWPVVVMSTYVKYAEILYKAFKDAGIPTGLVTGRTAVYFDGREEVRVGTAKRHEIYKMVRERRLQVLIGTTLLDEGIDIPEIVTLLLAYAYKSVVGTKQRVGRALRSIMASQENPNFFKPFALIVDMQDKHIRVTPSNCRIWWYCSEPLWIKTRAYYTAVPNLIRDLAKVGESVMGMPPSQKICRIYGELARISREYGRVPGEKGFAVVYGDWVCTDALDSLISSVIDETKSTCGGIDSGGIEKALNEVRSHAARLTVLKCEHPVTYTIGDVYASAKELYAKCIEQIEQLVC